MYQSKWRLISLAVVTIGLFSNCARNVLRTGEYMPQIEIQMNNTAPTLDDYTNTTTYLPCRARLLNHHTGWNNTFTFPADLAVLLQNRIRQAGETGGSIGLSNTGSGLTASSLAVTVPRDGSWRNFYLRGTTASIRDKDAVLEMVENRPLGDNIVLSRKALMVTSAPPPSQTPEVEIIINTASHIDDYVTWSPTFCQIRLLNGGVFTANVPVRLQNMVSATGKVNFAAYPLPVTETAIASTLDLSLPLDTTWVNFYVAGRWGNASTVDKDAVIEVLQQPSNQLLGREGLMVRIRKNANTLQTWERNRFLDALLKVHATYAQYQKFMATHVGGLASSQAHGGSGFLPWHRAYTLHLERLMQGADPDVALHYWRFDQGAPNIFDDDYMGTPVTAGSGTGGFDITLSSPNPLNSWTISGFASGINRTMLFSAGSPASVISETSTLALGGVSGAFSGFTTMEGNPHGSAHTSFSGWVSDITTATRDPLFFMLHCNVDRLWAKWQWTFDRFDPLVTTTYDRQGAFPSVSPVAQKGHYLDDTMWPWNNETGGTGLAARPATADLQPFPIVTGHVFSPISNPTVKSMIDWRRNPTLTAHDGGLGFDYDDFNPFDDN